MTNDITHNTADTFTERLINLGVVKVRSATAEEVLSALQLKSHSTSEATACFCEASLFSNALRDDNIRQALRESTWVFADGVGVQTLASLQGTPFPERMPGPSFLLKACEYGLPHHWRHFFYGGALGVAEALAANLNARFPQLVVAGTFSPPFRDLTLSEDQDVKTLIESSGTDILWVALGSPRQELWVHSHRRKIGVRCIFPVGAAFDFHSGNRPWAPAWIRSLGLEWLFRMMTGGRRVFFRNCRCVTAVGLFLVTEFIRIKLCKTPQR
jgi:N-acetylglucosaminyldiphosphoundecaprenol N-acetyl-beta-D-mannosaminyltransferase